MAGVPHGENMWKNIILGIFITVAGYLIVYFITDKKKAKKEVKEKSAANENAWKSANDYIRSAAKKFENIACFSCDYDKMKAEMLRELDQDCNSLRNLKEEKLVDEKLKTVIDRNIGQFEAMKPVFTTFIDSMLVIKKDNPDNPDTSRINRAYQEFINTRIRLDTADNGEIDRLLDAVNKEYKLSLQRQVIKPEIDFKQLPGKWMVECKINMNFLPDGKINVTIDGETINGNWSREEEILILDLENGENLRYEILQLNNGFMRILPGEKGALPLGVCRVQ